jgi:hypothetical protein
VSKMTVYETVSGQKIEIDSSQLVRTPLGGYAIRNGASVWLGAQSPLPPPPTPSEDGPAVSTRLVKLEGRLSRFEERVAGVEGQLTRLAERVARLDERLVGVERRLDSEAAAAVKTIVRDERGRITGLLSEPSVVKHQPVRNQ